VPRLLRLMRTPGAILMLLRKCSATARRLEKGNMPSSPKGAPQPTLSSHTGLTETSVPQVDGLSSVHCLRITPSMCLRSPSLGRCQGRGGEGSSRRGRPGAGRPNQPVPIPRHSPESGLGDHRCRPCQPTSGPHKGRHHRASLSPSWSLGETHQIAKFRKRFRNKPFPTVFPWVVFLCPKNAKSPE